MRILQSVKPAPVLTVLLIVLLLNAGCGGKTTPAPKPVQPTQAAAAQPTQVSAAQPTPLVTARPTQAATQPIQAASQSTPGAERHASAGGRHPRSGGRGRSGRIRRPQRA